MKYYSREVTRREPINRFGKRIRFVETSDKALVKKLRSGKINTVYSEKSIINRSV